jgi:hypothetical protein
MVAKALMAKALMAKVMVAKAMAAKVAAVALATAVVLGINSHFLQGVGCKLHDLATWQHSYRGSSRLKMSQAHAAHDHV